MIKPKLALDWFYKRRVVCDLWLKLRDFCDQELFFRPSLSLPVTNQSTTAQILILSIQVKPKGGDKTRITLDDLISCNQGKTVVSILTDIHGFCAYENRERIAADQNQDDYE